MSDQRMKGKNMSCQKKSCLRRVAHSCCRTLAVFFALCTAAPTPSSAALPTLSGLAEQFAALQTHYAESTNRIATLQARFDALQSRLADATNANSRLIAAFNATDALRQAFHGGSPVPSYITNWTERTVARIDTYPDGYTHRIDGWRKRIKTPEELAAIVAARKSPEVRRQKQLTMLKDSEASLTKILETSTNDVERARAVITLHNVRRNILRLENSGTNTVNVTITPKAENEK